MDAMRGIFRDVMEFVRWSMSELYNQRVKEDTIPIQEITQTKEEFTRSLQMRMYRLKLTLASKQPGEARASKGATPRSTPPSRGRGQAAWPQAGTGRYPSHVH